MGLVYLYFFLYVLNFFSFNFSGLFFCHSFLFLFTQSLQNLSGAIIPFFDGSPKSSIGLFKQHLGQSLNCKLFCSSLFSLRFSLDIALALILYKFIHSLH